MLVVGKPDDARVAVRRTHIVGNVVAVQTQHPLAATRQVVAGGAADAARSNHDHIITPGRITHGICSHARRRAPCGSNTGCVTTVAACGLLPVWMASRLPGQACAAFTYAIANVLPTVNPRALKVTCPTSSAPLMPLS